jgi:hypothetical protein
MPGLRLNSFRQGDRSEYLAQYILSSLGIAIRVPREEDIGIDFYCSLANLKEGDLTFSSPFTVQIKSNSENVSYGGVDKKNVWKEHEIDWLFDQELPFLIGIADKEKHNIKLFITINILYNKLRNFFSGG